MVYNHVFDYTNDNYWIGLWGFDFQFFNTDKVGGGGFSKYIYLSIVMNLWPGYWGYRL